METKNYLLKFGLTFVCLAAMNLFVQGQTYTFSNATATGNVGPTQANVNAAYTGTTLDGNVDVIGGIQYWIVPSSGNYSIEGFGGQGYGSFGGRGAHIYGEFALVGGDTLKILVGQQAGDYLNFPATTYNHQFGGGGGSFITQMDNTPLVVAGGGGGNHGTAFVLSCDGQTTTAGSAGANAATIGAGGAAGSGGLQGNQADGGGGLLGNGTGVAAGQAFVNGGLGGIDEGTGGFGCGGGTSSFNNYRGGGGGGYSGGGGANNGGACCPAAGGGGSFNAGTNPTALAGVQLGQGSVVISSLCAVTSALVPDVPALSDITGSCSIPAPTAPTATNNCGTITGTSNVTFPITTGGTTVVTWTYDDGVNTVTQMQNVIVAPIILSPDSTSLQDLLGTCIVQANAINPTATNTCGTLVLGTSNVTFPVTAVGTTVVTWTFTDGTNTITQLQNVIITPINNGISQVGAALSADIATYTYQWLDCDNGNAIVAGETNQTYTPASAGNYAVELTFDNCVDTTACIPYTLIGINELDNQSFVMYPNPSKDGMFTITTTTPIIQINVVDALGRTIQLHADISTGLIDGSSLVSGKYIVSVITENNVYTKQLMILK